MHVVITTFPATAALVIAHVKTSTLHAVQKLGLSGGAAEAVAIELRRRGLRNDQRRFV